jgi:hypothetical protein
MRLPLLDAGGAQIGGCTTSSRLVDRANRHASSASSPGASDDAFVNANRIAELGSDGARCSWDLDLNPFKPMAGQFLIGKDVIDRKVGDQTVSDVGLREVDAGGITSWEVAKVRLVTQTTAAPAELSTRRLRRRARPVPGEQRGGRRAAAARLTRPRSPTSSRLPLARRRQIAEAMDDERLADVLEELPEPSNCT